jgi:hypothetical protein
VYGISRTVENKGVAVLKVCQEYSRITVCILGVLQNWYKYKYLYQYNAFYLNNVV